MTYEDEGRDWINASTNQGSPRWPMYPQKLWEKYKTDLSLTAV